MSVLKLLQQKKAFEEDLESSGSDLDLDNKKEEQKKQASDDEPEESAFKNSTDKKWKNRTRVLIVTARGSAPGFRRLVNDLVDLLPHSKKEVQLDYCLILYNYRLRLTKRALLKTYLISLRNKAEIILCTLSQEEVLTCIVGLESTQKGHLQNSK